MTDIMTRCWDGNPDNRPKMSEVVALLEKIDTSSGKGGMTLVDDVALGAPASASFHQLRPQLS